MTKNKLSHLAGGADIVGTLDDPYHDPDLGCTKNPRTCENFLICFCEEEQSRLRTGWYDNRYFCESSGRWIEKGGKNEKRN